MAGYFGRTFAGQRVMAILRGMTPERTVALAGKAWDLGIDLVEVPVQVDEAFASLTTAVRTGETFRPGDALTVSERIVDAVR